ncbi:hypothetical protein AKO1_014972 [Acrasis kona]|uniref:Glycosyltransferase 61 catalytic domain-containing protein n=1 Tax=Acrasis kona TaxID=1008807 RepID=A0AAW2Z0V3_9EUKA
MCVQRYTERKPDGIGKGTFLSLCPDFIKSKKNVPPPLKIASGSVKIENIMRWNSKGNYLETFQNGQNANRYDRGLFKPIQEQLTDIHTQCKSLVRGKTIFAKMQWEGMYWHLIKSHLSSLAVTMSGRHSDLHFVMLGKHDPVNFGWFSMLTKHCVRSEIDIPDGTCFEDAESRDLFGGSEYMSNWRDLVLSKLSLTNYPTINKQDKNRKPVLGLISRHNKRILLNERDLVVKAQESGFDVKVLVFEEMSIEEQIKATRESDVLMGIHGSGMLNQIFMRPGTIVSQIVPHGLASKGIETTYNIIGSSYGLNSIPLDITSFDQSVVHWHFMEDIYGDDFIDDEEGSNSKSSGFNYRTLRKSEILNTGGNCIHDMSASRILLVQQDVVVPLDVFAEHLNKFKKALLNPPQYPIRPRLRYNI